MKITRRAMLICGILLLFISFVSLPISVHFQEIPIVFGFTIYLGGMISGSFFIAYTLHLSLIKKKETTVE